MREIITITGDVGSGKSTVGKIIAESLGYRHISTGLILREIAMQRGMTIVQMNERLFDEQEIDEEIDAYIRRISGEGGRLVLDSRMAWHFAEDAFDVYVSVDPVVGAERVISAKRTNEVHLDLEDAVRNNLRRKALEDERFCRLYKVRCNELSNFDVMVDSTWSDPGAVAQVILQEYRDNSGHADKPKGYLCPRSLYPTKDVRDAAQGDAGGLCNSMAANGYDASFPARAVRVSNYFFILDGHRRTSCALRLGINHIPCVIHDIDEAATEQGRAYKEIIRSSPERPFIRNWEDAHSFRFASYPDAEGNPILK